MRKYWIVVVVLGLGIIALAGPVLGAFPETAHTPTPGYGAPIYAFEMAKTPADLIAVFGPEDDPLRPERIAQMDRGNLWDFPFMATYSLFMALFFYAAWKGSNQKMWLVFAGIGLLAGCADAIENMILLNLTSNLAEAPNIQWLGIMVWTKFLAIMVCISAAGAHLIKQRSILWKALGICSLLGGLTIFAGFLSPTEYGYLIGNGTTLGWVAMLLFAIYQSFFKRESS